LYQTSQFQYEVTLACDLACKHCRASAQEKPTDDELTTEQSKALIDQIASFPRRPALVMTGGDPFKRADLFKLIGHAVDAGLQAALTPSATPLATTVAICDLEQVDTKSTVKQTLYQVTAQDERGLPWTHAGIHRTRPCRAPPYKHQTDLWATTVFQVFW
jgi:organic radical activating enzyme